MTPPRRAWSAAALAAALAACGSSGSSGKGDLGPSDGLAETGAGDAAEAGDAASDEAPSPMLTCPSYCAAIMAACTGSNQQYSDNDDCLQSCKAFPIGQPDDNLVDSLGCRVAHTANAAASADDAKIHCVHAGPGGDSICGDNCSGYCDIVMMYCTEANNAKIYDTRAACMTDCATRSRTMPYSAADPGSTDTGNEIGCILYYAQMGSSAPGEHCLANLALTAGTCRP